MSCATQHTEPLPYYDTPDFTPLFLKAGEARQLSGLHTIAPFSFTNQYGRQVTEKTVDGKIHAANFIFTVCGSICPTLTGNMKKVQEAFAGNKDVVLLSYTVTPWIDSVPRLLNYAKANGIDSAGWHLLTGNKSDIYLLARQSYFAEEDLGFTRDSTEFLHTEHVLLIDRKRHIRGIYNGTLALEMEQLIRDIRQLEEE